MAWNVLGLIFELWGDTETAATCANTKALRLRNVFESVVGAQPSIPPQTITHALVTLFRAHNKAAAIKAMCGERTIYCYNSAETTKVDALAESHSDNTHYETKGLLLSGLRDYLAACPWPTNAGRYGHENQLDITCNLYGVIVLTYSL